MAKKKKKDYLFFILLVLVVVLAILILVRILHKQKGAEIGPLKVDNKQEQPPKQPAEQIQPSISEVKPNLETELGQYYTASFVDSFSGQAWLDAEQTNFYFDWTSTNLLFPPVLKTKEILTPVLDNFIPKEVAADSDVILFFGTHRLSQKKEIVVWQLPQTNADGTRTNADMESESALNRWSKYDGEILGFEKDEEILQVKFLNKNKWLVLSRLDGVLKLNFLELSAKGGFASGGKKEDLISTPFETTENLICQQEAQIECDSEKCLLSCSDKWEFWEINLANKHLQKLEKLSASLQQNKPEQITIFPAKGGSASGGNFQSIWLIVRSQKIKEKEYQIILEQLNADQTLESFAPTQKAEYPGRPSLLQFDDKIFLFWGSYFTQAYEINAKGEVADLTSFFGWRISANKPYHLYKLPHSIYIKNEDRSIIRWGGGTNVRIDPQFWLTYSPEFLRIIPDEKSDSGYLVAGVPSGGTKVYWFSDSGFDLSRPQTVTSKKVNFDAAKIAAARITRLDGNSENAKTKHWLSNDGGLNWQATQPGEITLFDTQGNDLRWKIEITPSQSGTSYITPYLGAIYLEYWYQR